MARMVTFVAHLNVGRATTDGFSGARIEKEVIVTNDGCRIITLFPSEQLPIANEH